MTTKQKLTCPKCGEDAALETTDLVDEWPRELSYTCPNGHRNVVMECSDPKSMPPPAPIDTNLPTKHIYKTGTRQEQEIELYCAASTVRRKIGQSIIKAHAYLNMLEDYINGAIIQHHRIQEDKNLMDNALMEFSQHAFMEIYQPSLAAPYSWTDKLGPAQWTLILDIHFYLICLDKIDKLYRLFLSSISPLGKGAEDSNQRRVNRRLVESKFRNSLQEGLGPDDRGRTARDFLEHIEERIRDGLFDGLAWGSDERGMRFTCGKGEKKYCVVISIKKITDAYEALIEMLRSLPDQEL
jgi:hypothetical protein